MTLVALVVLLVVPMCKAMTGVWVSVSASSTSVNVLDMRMQHAATAE